MCYGKTEFTPGRYLEDGFRSIGHEVDVIQTTIDFGVINQNDFLGVIFVESPSKTLVRVKNINLARIPILFWIHHGENRLKTNIYLSKMYNPDLILLAHSLHLAKNFPAPVKFFPFAMSTDIFNCSQNFSERKIDIAFVGSKNPSFYKNRALALSRINKLFGRKYRLSLGKKIFLKALRDEYCNSKIVINYSADRIKSLNMRIFEGIGCGSLVITDYVPGLENIFQENEHCVIFKNQQDLISKINYYLKNPSQAELIAQKGKMHLLRHHTYEHRAMEVINIMSDLYFKKKNFIQPRNFSS
ncbi:hypothetical protein ABE29_11565 [Cytobacillus firmus]|nr:hypothetical protein [Cytobacillus firmus]MBG9553959.1 hypothetical protein [Cytobacillus firmus]MBG9558768.1 hypothetical protein [Cytobacillus firmus]MBG9575844.1 hypothetical protein [Cytobacillus firmus]MBG9655118.1 hypothetical protein [Cytobacillus firmus]